MMSLGIKKGGVITPSAEDRKKIITQMKVRTTLKGDKSWIHPQNSDNEEEKRSSPLHSLCTSGKIDGGSPASASDMPQSTRLLSSKPTSGYLIRGVFTRTIDKTPPESNSYSNGTQKSASTQAKSASLPHFPSGYKMTTEDYKKLAPFNVKQTSVDSDEGEPSFSQDEHRKRTEAANSVLRRTASKERSYVLSAAKKSNGSPTQEVPPFIAKRVEIEEEGRPRRRSQTLPASSSTNGVRESPTGSSWREPKPVAAVSTTSLETNNQSQATRSWSENTSQISTFTESSNKFPEEEPAGTSPGETRTPKPALAMAKSQERIIDDPKPMPLSEVQLRTTRSAEKSDKEVKEEPDLISWDESIPKATPISMGESEKEEGTLETRACVDSRGPFSSEKSHETRKQNIILDQKSEGPLIVIATETSHKGASSQHTDSSVNTTPEIHHRHRVPEYLDETNFDLPRPSSQSGDMLTHPTSARFKAPTYLDDAESEPKRPSSEDRSAVAQEVLYKVPVHLDDEDFYVNSRFSSHSTDSNATITDSRHRVPVHMEDGELDPERSVSRHEERETTRESRNENHRATEHNELDLNMTKITPGYEERISTTREMSFESPQTRRHNKPDVTTAKESTVSMTETSHAIPSNLNLQQITTTMPEPSPKMPSYLDSQTLNNQTYKSRSSVPGSEGRSTMRESRHSSGGVTEQKEPEVNVARPVSAYEERSSPRDTRYESLRTSGHSEFDPSMGRHYSHSRDSSTIAMSQESRSRPCSMDGSESDTSRLPSASGERLSISTASSQYNSPSAMGHESNPSTSSKGILFVKEYVNSRELSPTPRYSSGSLVDLSDLDRASFSNTSYLYSSTPQRSSEGVCTYCGREIRDCPKIMIEHLNVYCHEYCFRCGICHKAMGDLLDKIFIHRDIVHCDQCYEKLF